MTRQSYFPVRQAEQPEWFSNYKNKISAHATACGIAAGDITDTVDDSGFCGYTSGLWLTQARQLSPAATAALEEVYSGTTAGAFVLPGFVAPTLPVGVTPVDSGALLRIFAFIAILKQKAGYNETMGQDLRVIGPEVTQPDLPEFSLVLEMGTACHCVRIRFKKFGRMGVVVESKRGTGPWETLGIDTSSPYLDERLLLVATQPEVREYRLRFWENGIPTGDWTPVQRTTVSPA